jgi:hypothetical protein
MSHLVLTHAPAAVLWLLLALIASTGCAIGHKFSYTDAPPRLAASGTTPVAVTVHDQRKRVTSGKEDPTFVGELRSLYHIPYGVHTASGKPLAEDLTTVLASSFSTKGFQAIPVISTSSENPEELVRRMARTRADRSVVLTLLEWRTDTYFKTQLFYELALKIIDGDAKTLAEQRASGHEDEVTDSASDAFRRRVEPLLNHPTVTEMITLNRPAAATPTVASPTSGPSYWQIFSYAKGMSDRSALLGPHPTVEACRSVRNEIESQYADRLLVCEFVTP